MKVPTVSRHGNGLINRDGVTVDQVEVASKARLVFVGGGMNLLTGERQRARINPAFGEVYGRSVSGQILRRDQRRQKLSHRERKHPRKAGL